jgi:predicted ATPase/DNA-binding CsgD family transcriptional regulator
MQSATSQSGAEAAPAASGLPAELNSFVGRRRELAEIGDQLARTRLLTLTGSGGCGKTRLAARAAARATTRFPDGVHWVDLASLTEAPAVTQALAEAISVRPLPGQSAGEAALNALRDRQALVVLDNCEHLIEEAARTAEALLCEAPTCAVLATSRAPLAAAGETAWLVPSLSLPAEGDDEPGGSDAVDLFVERARRVRPGFALGEGNAAAVARVCRDLDGIPLAIELAAARLRMMEVGELAAALNDRFALLASGERTAQPRHRTLRASVAWSHELLDEQERALFRRLAVFEGGWELEAAAAVCGTADADTSSPLDLLAALVDQSLVVVERAGGRSRYRMLETIRHFAIERLAESGEEELLRRRHCGWFLDLAERAAPELIRPEQNRWIARLDADAANLHGATAWATGADPELALRLGAALTLFWKLRGRYAEADAVLADALAAGADAPPQLRSRVLWGRAYIGTYAGDYEQATAYAEAALELGTEIGDASIRARALDVLGTIQLLPDPVAAAAIEKQARELALEAGDEWCWVDATQIRAYAQFSLGRMAEAEATMEECAPAIEAIGSGEFASWRHFLLGAGCQQRGELDAAEAAFALGIETADAVGEPASGSFSAAYLALTLLQRGSPTRAGEILEPRLQAATAAGAGIAVPNLCFVRAALEAPAEPKAALDRIEGLLEETGPINPWLASQLLVWLGALELALGRETAALARAAALEGVAERLDGDPITTAQAAHLLGLCALRAGEPERAERLLHDALGLRLEHSMLLDVPDSLDALARCAAARQEPARAARLLGAAARMRQEGGLVRWRPDATPAAELERALADGDHGAAFAEGRELAPAEALAWARGNRGRRGRPTSGWDSLTATERRVVEHAARGLTNPQIGERMFIAPSTVKVHLSRVYAKLGIANRVELAALVSAREP